MNVDNVLTLEFIERHPVDAARVLARLSTEHCRAFLEQLDGESLKRLFPLFTTNYAARCLVVMSDQLLNRCAENMPVEVCRALIGLTTEQQDAIIKRLNPKLSQQVIKQLSYPMDSVARFVQHKCPVLPASMQVGEALKLLEKMDYEDGCQLNLIDDDNRLLGHLDIGRLIHSNHNQQLSSILRSPVQDKILLTSLLADVEHLPAWLSHRQLPVVDHKGVFVGELNYEMMKMFYEGAEKQPKMETFDGLLSLAGQFWITASWLVDCLFGAVSSKEDRSQ